MERYRLNVPTFNKLAETLNNSLRKEDTNMRSAISPKKRLVIFLHWMAQGGEYHELATDYCVGTSTVHSIVHEVLPLVCGLAHTEIVFPTTKDSLRITCAGLEALSGLPGCC